MRPGSGWARAGAFREPLLLRERVRHHRVTTHREVEDDRVVVEEAILPQHADPRALDQRERPFGGRLIPGQQAHERALARAVGADQPVAGAGVELQADIGEQRARAVLLGEGGRGDHRVAIMAPGG